MLANTWSIVSSPVAQQPIKNFAENIANGIRINTTPNPDRYAIGVYNDANAVNSKWEYFDANVNAALEFDNGKGYAMSRTTDGVLTFAGTMNVSNVTTTVLPDKWNAIGNPFTSYYPVNKNSNSSFLNENSANLDAQAVYIWDNAQNKYVAANDLAPSTDRSLSPGQGFFVKTKLGITSLLFNKDKRSTKPSTGNNVFNKSSTPYIQLFVEKGKIKINTDIIYLDVASKGFDAVYDIVNFDTSDFDLTTHLLEGSVGKNYTIQSLPNKNYKDQIIPISLIAKANSKISFSAVSKNLPDGLMVFIEDKKTSSYHKLDETGEKYQVQLDKQEKGAGRFYLHTTTQTLNINEEALSDVKVFSSNSQLNIVGMPEQKIKVELFDLLGKQVFEKKLQAERSVSIKLGVISKGIYIVNIKTKEGNSITKKITIK